MNYHLFNWCKQPYYNGYHHSDYWYTHEEIVRCQECESTCQLTSVCVNRIKSLESDINICVCDNSHSHCESEKHPENHRQHFCQRCEILIAHHQIENPVRNAVQNGTKLTRTVCFSSNKSVKCISQSADSVNNIVCCGIIRQKNGHQSANQSKWCEYVRYYRLFVFLFLNAVVHILPSKINIGVNYTSLFHYWQEMLIICCIKKK